MLTKILIGGLIAMAGNGAVQEDVEEPLEQLSQQEIGTFTATHYTAYCDGCSGITYNGTDVRNTIYKDGYNVIAVDIDILVQSKDEAYSNGVKEVKVYRE